MIKLSLCHQFSSFDRKQDALTTAMHKKKHYGKAHHQMKEHTVAVYIVPASAVLTP